MNYADMSDLQINKAVANCLGAKVVKSSFGAPCFKPDFSVSELSPGGPAEKFNPCKSWAYAGPIIEKHLICLAADVFAEPQDGGKWVAQPAYGWDSERVRSDNPLRAAMIVFLKMKEGR